jgi:hypothetical protein
LRRIFRIEAVKSTFCPKSLPKSMMFWLSYTNWKLGILLDGLDGYELIFALPDPYSLLRGTVQRFSAQPIPANDTNPSQSQQKI